MSTLQHFQCTLAIMFMTMQTFRWEKLLILEGHIPFSKFLSCNNSHLLKLQWSYSRKKSAFLILLTSWFFKFIYSLISVIWPHYFPYLSNENLNTYFLFFSLININVSLTLWHTHSLSVRKVYVWLM